MYVFCFKTGDMYIALAWKIGFLIPPMLQVKLVSCGMIMCLDAVAICYYETATFPRLTELNALERTISLPTWVQLDGRKWRV